MLAHPQAVIIGRCGVDLYPTQVGERLGQAGPFSPTVGGTAANVAIAAARLGVSTALVSGVGNDPWAEFVLDQVAGDGVDVTSVCRMPGTQTPLTLCEMLPPENFPLYFYRVPPVPDEQLSLGDIPWEAVHQTSVVWLTGSALSPPRLREVHQEVASRWHDHHAPGAHLALDLDYRAAMWDTPEHAHTVVSAFLPQATVVVGNQHEWEVATGEADALAAARATVQAGAALAVVKRGEHGLVGITAEREAHVPGLPVPVVNGLGCGDAAGGALIAGLVQGLYLEDVMRRANAAGAHVAQHPTCSTAMPTSAEVETCLAEYSPDLEGTP